jgi:multidrug efflux pump subunit AcrB
VMTATTGKIASRFSIAGEDGYGVRLRFDPKTMTTVTDLSVLQSPGPDGTVPLKEMAQIRPVWHQSKITRQGLLPVVNLLGYRSRTAITHLQDQVAAVLSDMELPGGYTLSQEGEIRQMGETFGNLGASMALALIFLYFSLVIAFKSYVTPLIIMSAIPLAFIGVPWGMLLMDRHFCMPAAMGMILLSGIVVNNSIMLVDFIETARISGTTIQAAIEDAIRRRTRPILMTALSTIAGMFPIAAEMAVGLERLSPLAVVAIAGLLVSTFLTLAYIPVLYLVTDQIKAKIISPSKELSGEDLKSC